MDYSKYVSPRKAQLSTPQTKKIPGKESLMAKNNAGGVSFKLDAWAHLDRFLVLGSEGGTYYVSEKKLTKQNAKNVEALLKTDGVRVVNRVVEISKAGRAPKNDPALFVLAMASASEDDATRKAALAALPEVARIGTHLFQYAQFVQGFRGWGRGLRNAVGAWYNAKDINDLQYQLMKYQQRNGWSHRDLLRLAHPKSDDVLRNTLYQWAVDKSKANIAGQNEFVRLEAAQQALRETDANKAAALIAEFNLPREVVNTELLQKPLVWDALLQRMPVTAMLRNLGNMTKAGILSPMSANAVKVVQTLTNPEVLKKGRVHPLAVLVALNTYNQGQGHRGSGTWTPNQDIVDALDEAFYMTFETIERTGKRYLLGLDVSGSMTWGNIAGLPGIMPCTAAAAMAMVTARTEPVSHIMGFSSSFKDLGIGKRDRLDAVQRKTQDRAFGGTDASLPMKYAQKNKLDIDAFIVYTDNDTWCGNNHPCQALVDYRNKRGIDAKLIVVGMTSSGFTIADPTDAGMLDIVGFDTAAPQIMNTFVGGKL